MEQESPQDRDGPVLACLWRDFEDLFFPPGIGPGDLVTFSCLILFIFSSASETVCLLFCIIYYFVIAIGCFSLGSCLESHAKWAAL